MAVHVPVLLREAVEYLSPRPGGAYADLTLGLGGHAMEILRRIGPEGRLAGVDRDAGAIEIAKENLSEFSGSLTVIQANFAEAAGRMRQAGIERLDGFLMDLGVSMLQLKTPERGFSFSADAPLDMRMDASSGMTAAELLAELDEAGLARVIREYGEEKWAKAIARRIKERMRTEPVRTTRQLADTVAGAIPRKFWPPRTHPATRTFQALRIAVNEELESLTAGLESMLGMLAAGGRAVVISYHSLEDRAVKTKYREWARGCICPPDFPKCVCGRKPRLKILTGRPVLPSEEETIANPSARSAKLRAAERT